MRKSTIFWLSILIGFLGLIVYYFYPESKLKDGQKADKIIINKSNHELLLYYKEELMATYKVALGTNGLHKKTKLGDGLTPEGSFKGKKRTQSNFHKAIAVGEWGVRCNVLIHGQKFSWIRKFQPWYDWTHGCIALTNDEIDEIYKAVNNNVLIEINQ